VNTNWVIEEAKKFDCSKDVAILENPEKKKCLDDILIKRFWPVARESIEDTMYNYWPADKPEIEFEFSYILTRSMAYMLFDGNKAFFRGKLSCSMRHWILNSEFWLGLRQDTDILAITKILQDPLLRGIPPTLTLYEDNFDDYYQIKIENGSGADWGYNDDQYIFSKIKKAIDVSTGLYEIAGDGVLEYEEVDDFLSLLHEVYEAY
jgi:hypothetical protein